MGNMFKVIDKKPHILLFNYMINMKNFDANKVKLDEKSDTIILIYYIGYVTVKDLRHVKIYSLNPLYLVIGKINGYNEESNGRKYLTRVRTDESKEK